MRIRHKDVATVAILLVIVTLLLPGAVTHAQAIANPISLAGDGVGIAVNSSTHRVYAAVAGGIAVYDASTHALITTIPLPQNYTACYDVAVNPTTNRIYAVGFRTYVIDGNSNTVVTHFDLKGNAIAVNPASNRVYVASMVNYPYSDPHQVHVLNGANNTWLPAIVLGNSGSYASIYLAANPTTNRLYIAWTGDGNLRVVNGSTHAEITRLPLANIGRVAVNPATNRIYAGTNYVDVAVLDGATHAQLATIPNFGWQLLINPETSRLYTHYVSSPGYVVRIADLNLNRVVSYVYLEGDLEDFDIDTGTGKLFGTNDRLPAGWGQKITVIWDASPMGPAPMPTPPCHIATVDLPEQGGGVGVNSVTDRVYVGVDGGLVVLDAETLASLDFIDLSSDGYLPPIYDVGVNETLNRIFVVSVSQTWVIDGGTHQIIGTLGYGDEIAVNPNNGRVYLARDAVFLGQYDKVVIYDGVGLTHIRSIDLGKSSYYQWSHIAVNPTTGYAYSAYSLDDNLRIISPTTDDVVQTIDYTSIGEVAVDPVANRVYVWISRGGQSGALVLDGSTHAELTMIAGMGGQLEMNAAINHLYGVTGSTLFKIFDPGASVSAGHAYLDGRIEDYAVHTGLHRLYVTHAESPPQWAKKLSVIQDAGPPPPPSDWAYLPVVVRN